MKEKETKKLPDTANFTKDEKVAFEHEVKNQKGKMYAGVKKHAAIWITAASVVTVGAGLTAGHYIYKTVKENSVQERVIVDPSKSSQVDMTELKTDPKTGNASCNVKVKDTVYQELANVEVYIGNDKLVQGEDYEVKQANAEAGSYNVEIKKSALDKHEGKVIVNPIVKDITYVVSFVPGDGHTWKGKAPESQTVKKHGKATAPAVESNEGEVPEGWEVYDADSGEWKDFDFSVVLINKDITVRPKWKMVKRFNVVFIAKLNDSSETISDQHVLKGTTLNRPDATKVGYTLDGWYKKDDFTELWNFDQAIDESNCPYVLYAKWNINKYTVNIDINGGELESGETTVTVDHGKTIEKAPVVKKTGYKLNESKPWLINGTDNEFKFGKEGIGTVVTSHLTVKANWEADKVIVYFMRTKSKQESEQVDKQTVLRDNLIIKPQYSPDPAYSVKGWKKYDDDEAWDFNKTVTGTYTELYLYVDLQIEYYNVSFDTTGVGGSVSSQKVKRNGTIANPQLVVPGKKNIKWHTGSASGPIFDFSTTLIEPTFADVNITLYASADDETYTVTYDSDGGSTVQPSTDVAYNETLSQPSCTKEGHTLDKWVYVDASGTEQEFTFGAGGTKVTSNMLLRAKWTKDTYTVTATGSAGGSGTISTTSPQYGDLVTATATPDTGYEFEAWHKGSVSGETIPDAGAIYKFTATEDIALYATFKLQQFTVKFDAAGGDITSGQSSINVNYGATIPESSKPTATRDGYEFKGWFDGDTEFIFGTTCVYSTTTLTARWEKVTQYTVTFDIGGGSGTAPDTAVVAKNGTIASAPAYSGTKAGYTLDSGKWYKDAACTEQFIFGAVGTGTSVTSDLVLHAKWTENTPSAITSLALASGTTSIKEGGHDQAVATLGDTYAGSIKYSIDDTSKATIDTNTGYITGVAEGNATITATYYKKDGTEPSPTVTKTLPITVTTATQYTVTFDIGGGSGTAPDTALVVKNGTIASAPAYSGTKAGYTLDSGKWYTDAACTEQFKFGAVGTGTSVTSDLVLHAKWTENTPSTITLALASGTTSIKEGEHDQAVATLGDTYAGSIKYKSSDTGVATINENTGYITGVAAGNAIITATYYKKDGTEPSPTVTNTLDITVTAPATSHIVSFNSNGGDAFVPAVSVTDGGRIASEPSAGSKTGFTFEGWHIGSTTGTKFEFGATGTQVTSDITLVANWTDEDPVTKADLAISGTVSQGQTVQGTVTFKDKDGNPVTTPTGTVLWAITGTQGDATATIDQNGLLTGGTGNGAVSVTVTYTTAGGTVITSNTCNVGIYNNP